MRMLVAVGVISYLLPLTSYLFSSCAKMGSPDGGWFDDDAQQVERRKPAERSRGVRIRKVETYFDDVIKLGGARSRESM